MTHTVCPGQDTRYWKPGDIFEVACPACGGKVEFFKDDVSRKCSCGHRVENPRVGLGCARWCEHAAECLGPEGSELAGGSQTAQFRARLIAAMIEQFGTDTKRIDHALSVLAHAEAIRDIEGGDALVITAAALLHDIGIQEAERIYGSSAPRYQEELGPSIARYIMEGLGIDEATVEHVVRIVGSHHSARDIDTIEFRIIWDADALVNLGEEEKDRPTDWWERTISKVFRTSAGRQRARQLSVGPND